MLHRLFAAQVLRDEVMAETIQRALTAAGPRARMVVLVGNGHLAFGTGVNARLARRWPTATQRTVMCVSVPVPPWSRPVSTGLADVLVGTVAHGWKQRYPSLGVRIRDRPAPGGGVTVRGLRRGPSPAREAGLRPGDVITHLDGDPVADPFALRWALSRKSWGDALRLRWRRDGQAHRARVVLRRPTPKEADRKSRR
jgi:hypothetical protein